MMRFISLFSGIEAAAVALRPLGWQCVAVAEIDPFCCDLLAHYYPDVPNLGDVTAIAEAEIAALGLVDVVIFGSPCQDLSVAGKRAGLKGKRSGLFFTAMDIVRWSGARFALWENVPGAFSSNDGDDFALVVGEMAGVELDTPRDGWRNTGVALGPDGLVEWVVLDAQWFGVPQRRRRIFALRDSGDWRGRGPVLFDADCLQGNPAPRRKTRQDVAPTISARTKGGGGLGTDFDLDGGLQVAMCLNAKGGMGRIDAESETFVTTGQGYWNESDVAATLGTEARSLYESTAVTHSLRGEGFNASEDGTGRGTPLVSVAFDARQDCVSSMDAFGSLGSSSPQAQAVAFQESQTGVREYPEAGTLRANGPGHDPVGTRIRDGMMVRRLTPVECERLQGFPDNYTQVPYRNRPAADGPRYKALGNSMAVPCIAWLGRRILEAAR